MQPVSFVYIENPAAKSRIPPGRLPQGEPSHYVAREVIGTQAHDVPSARSGQHLLEIFEIRPILIPKLLVGVVIENRDVMAPLLEERLQRGDSERGAIRIPKRSHGEQGFHRLPRAADSQPGPAPASPNFVICRIVGY